MIDQIETVTDDPYYCGLRARVPNFVKTSKGRGKDATKRLSIAQLHHPASLASIHQLHHNHPAHMLSPHQQQMMFHARSYESGIGMYNRNLILEPFPYRYRNYLQDWHDNSVELPTRNHTDKHRPQPKLERHQQQHLDLVDTNPNAYATNIIVTKNPLCASNYGNRRSYHSRDKYGYCKPQGNSNYGHRFGSDSDIVNIDDEDRHAEEYFSDSLERSRYYEDAAMSKSRHKKSSIHPFYQNHNYPNNGYSRNYHQIYSDRSHMYDDHYHNGYTLRRTASNESFFGVPAEPKNVKSIYHKNHKHKKSKKYENRAQRNQTKLVRSSSDRSISHVQVSDDRRSTNYSIDNHSKYARSSDRHSTNYAIDNNSKYARSSDRQSTNYSIDNHSKYSKRIGNSDETETVYGYLKPRKHSFRAH